MSSWKINTKDLCTLNMLSADMLLEICTWSWWWHVWFLIIYACFLKNQKTLIAWNIIWIAHISNSHLKHEVNNFFNYRRHVNMSSILPDIEIMISIRTHIVSDPKETSSSLGIMPCSQKFSTISYKVICA